MSSPLILIAANLRWNAGLLNVSATNSARLSAPYAVSSEPLVSSYSLVSCLVRGCDLLLRVLITAA